HGLSLRSLQGKEYVYASHVCNRTAWNGPGDAARRTAVRTARRPNRTARLLWRLLWFRLLRPGLPGADQLLHAGRLRPEHAGPNRSADRHHPAECQRRHLVRRAEDPADGTAAHVLHTAAGR